MLPPVGKMFVKALFPRRDRLRAIPFSVLLVLLAACSSPLEKAQREAAEAQVLFDNGNLPGARQAIARALAHRDDQLDILVLDARIKSRMGDIPAAYDAYKTVLVFDPNNREALTSIVQIAQMYDDKATMREMSKRALALDPENAEVLLSQGVMNLKEKKYDAAIANAEVLLKDPADPRGTVLKARALFLKGERKESYAILRKAAADFGNNQLVSAALLENARAEGDVPRMLEQFIFLSSADVKSPDLMLDETNVRYKAGQLQGARETGFGYLAQFASSTDTAKQLIDLWEEYDADPLTMEQIRLLAENGSVEAKLAVGGFFLRRGNTEAVVPLVGGAGDPRIMGLMARLHVARGNPAGYQIAQQILNKDQANCEALQAAAQWELDHVSATKSIIHSQVLATQCRDRIDGYLLLAAAYQKLGRAPAIERAFREGMEAHPQSPLLVRRFTDWLLAQGRNGEAVAATRRLTVLAPSRVSSWLLRLAVCRRAGDKSCVLEAEGGLGAARKAFTVDPLPGVKRGDALFGRTWQ